MRIEELIKELKIYQKEMPSRDVLFRFDTFETANFEITFYDGKILIDLDYCNLLEDDEWN